MTAPATIGLAVNSGTWALISMVEPYLQRRYDLGSLAGRRHRGAADR